MRGRLLLPLALAGCVTGQGPRHGDPTAEPEQEQSASSTTSQPTSVVHTTTIDGPEMHRAQLREVYLDPSGTSAVSLDVDGEVRFWPRLATDDPVEPLPLPIRDPQFLTLAPLEGDADGQVGIAWIDVARRMHFGRLETSDGGRRATYVHLADSTPTDTAFEVHMLDGGRRALVLADDHSIRIYDFTKAVDELPQAEVTRLERPGFVPWQLRVQSDPKAGQDHAVAILAGPVRAVPLSIGDDAIELGTETPELPLDRGPNRNDLALAPDGKSLFLFRRPGAKTKEVHLYTVDLDSGAIRVLGGEVDARWRARMLVTGPHEVLLETGIDKGYYFDLSGARPLEEIRTVVKRRKERLDPKIEPGREVSLPRTRDKPDRSFEIDVERYAGRRMHVDARGGMRVVPEPEGLLVDPLDGNAHFVHGTDRPFGQCVAVSPSGEKIGYATAKGVFMKPRGDGALPATIARTRGCIALGFVGEDEIAMLDTDRDLTIYGRAGADALTPRSTTRVDVQWAVAEARFVQTSSGTVLYARGTRPRDPIHRVSLGAGTPEDGTIAGDAADEARFQIAFDRASDAKGRTYVVEEHDANWEKWSGDHDEPRVLVLTDGEARHETPLVRGASSWIAPSPDATRLAVLEQGTLTLFDAGDLTRLWSVACPARDISWSPDGKSIYSAGREILQIDAQTGEALVLSDLALPFHERRPD